MSDVYEKYLSITKGTGVAISFFSYVGGLEITNVNCLSESEIEQHWSV